MYSKRGLILYNRWLIPQDALNPGPIPKSFMCMLIFKQIDSLERGLFYVKQKTWKNQMRIEETTMISQEDYQLSVNTIETPKKESRKQEKARKTKYWRFVCATNKIRFLSNFMALQFWNKCFTLWLGHCWKCDIAPSGLSYPKVTNCPCGTSR